jgi:predicted O-methyltransferase YrrM
LIQFCLEEFKKEFAKKIEFCCLVVFINYHGLVIRGMKINKIAKHIPVLNIFLEWKQLRRLIRKYEKFNPPGHYYSPVPDEKTIPEIMPVYYTINIPGLNLNDEEQISLLGKLLQFYHVPVFPSQKDPDFRYYFNNDHIGYSDGIILSAVMQYFKPGKIIEVGSGFSSALMLDTNERVLNSKVELTFIEPFPEERLNKLVRPGDNCKIIREFVQNIDETFWNELNENDILFIDSSHVLKFRSDVDYLFFRVLPLLKSGVIIHIHDVFFPFEYPIEWLRQGRAWNESYFLRAFLQYNSEFEILLFSSFMEGKYRKWYEENMPLCLMMHKKIIVDGRETDMNTCGQSIYIRKK